jgi:hypothetical protein
VVFYNFVAVRKTFPGFVVLNTATVQNSPTPCHGQRSLAVPSKSSAGSNERVAFSGKQVSRSAANFWRD